MEFFDSHSHYNDEKFDEDREQVIEETQRNNTDIIRLGNYAIDEQVT